MKIEKTAEPCWFVVSVGFYIPSLSNNKNIKKTDFVFRFFFYCELYFMVIAVECLFYCVDFVD